MRLFLPVLIALLDATTSAPALAQGFDMGPLNPFLQEASDRVWTIRNQAGAVLMENRATPGHLNYYRVETPPGTEGRREISVDVAILGSNNDSLAGLLYGFQSQPKSYYLFTVGGDRSVNLHQMTEAGMHSRMKWKMPELKAERTTLTIREQGASISLIVNGVEKSSFGNERIGRGGVGIIAGGIGTYRFSQFRVAGTGEARSKAREPGPRPGKLVMHPIPDPNTGEIQMQVPLPIGWAFAKPGSGGVNITGPDGITVSGTANWRYTYSEDAFALQSARTLGRTMIAPPMTLEQFLREVWQPKIAQQGYTLLGAYPLAQVGDFWRRMSQYDPGAPVAYDSIGTDWKRPDGSNALVTLTRSLSRVGPYTNWSIYAVELIAPARDFETAKSAYLYSMANTEFNPQYQRASAARLGQRLAADKAGWDDATARLLAGHRARMGAIEAAGNTSASIAKTYSEISDISHAGFLKRSSIVDRSQASVVDSIHGTTVISNAATGEAYRVPAGNKHYWVNNRAEYISTDNPLLDPRIDRRLNDSDWVLFESGR